jgi:hypothetical protein
VYGNGARCASPKVCRSHLLRGGHNPNSVFAPETDDAASTSNSATDASTRRFNFAAIFKQQAADKDTGTSR